MSWTVAEPGKALNPRYVAYCAGVSPRAVLARDRKRWPGGCMCGFMLWIRERWLEFKAVRPGLDMEFLNDADHAAFTAWLLACAGS